MNVAIYEEARDFAAEDWEHLSKGSRERLLMANGRSPIFSALKWRLLPESVKGAIMKPLIIEKTELVKRQNMKAAKRARG